MGSATESLNRLKRQIREAWKSSYPKEAEWRAQASQKVCNTLLTRPEFIKAKRIGIFAGRDSEVDLLLLFSITQRAFSLPKTHPQTKTLTFGDVNSATELRTGSFGILEPEMAEQPDLWTSEDLILVPGVAFDLFGNRIGNGAGYYDRFLSQNPQPKRWGIAFQQQYHDQELAHMHHDVRMEAIVTECGFFPAKKVES